MKVVTIQRGAGAVVACVLLGSAAGASTVAREIKVGSEAVPSALFERARTSCAALEEPERSCLESHWFDAFRWAVEGRTRGLEQSASYARFRRQLLVDALALQLNREGAEPSVEELRAFYEENRREFVRPEAIRIAWILVGNEQRAEELLASLPPVVSLEKFRAEARRVSEDAATRERGGDLGFVRPDGSTDVPEVEVPPLLYQAVVGLEEGALLRRPVSVEGKAAIVWRRGSRAAQEVSFESARELLRERVRERSGAARLEALRLELRQASLRAHHPEPLALLESAARRL